MKYDTQPIADLMDKSIKKLKKTLPQSKKIKYLPFEDVTKKGMSLSDVMRYYEPEISEDNILMLYEKMKKEAYRLAVLSRRSEVTLYMIFNCISNHYKELYLS